jgi:hypothetical protein
MVRAHAIRASVFAHLVGPIPVERSSPERGDLFLWLALSDRWVSASKHLLFGVCGGAQRLGVVVDVNSNRGRQDRF